MKSVSKNYTKTEINRTWTIKVSGLVNGVRVNILVGVDYLLRLVNNSWERLQKMVRRAFASQTFKCECKIYNGPKVTFYQY